MKPPNHPLQRKRRKPRAAKRCVYVAHMRFPIAGLLLLLLVPSVAIANIGLPMLMVVWPLSAWTVVPVIAVESWVVRRALDIDWQHAALQMTKANILSTLIGIPLAWIISLAIEFGLAALMVNVLGSKSYPPEQVGAVGGVILSAPWVGPSEHDLHWIIPLATIVLLVPFFFASYWIESWSVARKLSPEAPRAARRAVRNANLWSYLGIFVACVAWLLYGIATHA